MFEVVPSLSGLIMPRYQNTYSLSRIDNLRGNFPKLGRTVENLVLINNLVCLYVRKRILFVKIYYTVPFLMQSEVVPSVVLRYVITTISTYQNTFTYLQK
jgi:hypothetical protein